MSFKVDTDVRPDVWDAYVRSHPSACLYHLSGWLRVIQRTYGHPIYGLAVTESTGGIVGGVLPLVHMKHPVLGNRLVSIPFFDLGGVLADERESESTLIDYAIRLSQDLGARSLELRHGRPLDMFSKAGNAPISVSGNLVQVSTRAHKVRMLLDVPDSPDSLMKSFKSKLRSQINRPLKEGLVVKFGQAELVDDFYCVFLENMRDLGSPVHPKKLIQNVLAEFPGQARVFVVYKERTPLAAALVVGFKDVLENPWASALKRFSKLSANMLLYWGMLKFAAENGFTRFDFGRSTPGEGTFKFKQQWGAAPEPLQWYSFVSNGSVFENPRCGAAWLHNVPVEIWKRLPISVTRLIGPPIRKHISL